MFRQNKLKREKEKEALEKSNVDGDGGAKLEIRNRSATWAKFFDTANVAHEECLVGAGRSTVETGQTLKKIWYVIAEDVGIKEQ